MSFRGSPSGSTGPAKGLKRGRTGAVPTDLFIFEFWSDRRYDAYGQDDQLLLNEELIKNPRPDIVALPGGKYELQGFGEAHLGRAIQVNMSTQFERHVRLKPPYRFPGASTAPLPAGSFKFQYFDGGWHDYTHVVEKELQLFAQCAPPPSQIFFHTQGKAYWLLGLDKLSSGEQLMQVNSKTGVSRPVRLCADVSTRLSSGSMTTPVPPPPRSFQSPGRGSSNFRGVPGNSSATSSNGYPARGSASFAAPFLGPAPASGSSPPGSSSQTPHSFFSTSWRQNMGVGRGGRGAGTGSGAAASSSAIASPASFSVCSAQFRVCNRPSHGAGGIWKPMHEDAQMVLLNAFRRHPREASVILPSGNVVESFDALELDAAGVRGDDGTWMPVELHLPFPKSGTVQLPDELDSDTTFNVSSCGCYLTNQQVVELPMSNAGNCRECAICRCEFEVDDGGGNPVEQVFQLQCGHVYHGTCLEQWFNTRRRCPECQRDFGKVIGDQPRIGTMQWHTEPFELAGHRAPETIVVEFAFPPGVNDNGEPFEGRRPKGYLPGNCQGAILLELFKVAFRRRVMFGLGNSMTSGAYRPTFNIHIKTSTHRGVVGHGYPDPDYFNRSLEELRTNGVTIDDLPE